MSINDKIIDPANFDLDAFAKDCYQATRYVPIVQDQRLVGELLRLRADYFAALEFEGQKDVERTVVAMGDVSDLERAKAAYLVAYKAMESQKQYVEIRAVGAEKRNAITEAFLKEKGLTRAELASPDGKEALLEELDRRVMVDAFVAPRLPTVEAVSTFADAVGDAQWAQIKAAWAGSLTQAIDLERLSPDFLPKSWSEVDGEES